jgi:transposase, IS30 family
MKNHKYKHLTIQDRDRIQALLDKGHKQKEIAFILRVDKSTISREIRRNKRSKKSPVKHKAGQYESYVANHKAYLRRHFAKYEGKKIDINRSLRSYVIKRLELGWSPDEIAGRVRLEKQTFYVSKNTVYRWLYSNSGRPYTDYLYSRRKRSRKRKPKTKRTLIPNRIGLVLRPQGATNRSRYGHYEGDTMVSGRKTGSKTALSVMYERKTRYISAKKIPNMKPDSNVQAIVRMKKKLNKVKSLSLDNGIENTKYEEIGIPTYFCDPYSSWQKGGVEHAIKMIRRFIPKGVDINTYSAQDVKLILEMINHKPRKSLGYKTPYEVMVENNLLKQKSPTGKVALGVGF